VSVERPDADLDEMRGQAPFHDAGERRRMAQRVASEIVVNVRMRVEVQNVQGPAYRSDTATIG
jgi:hypothetical protein